MKRLCTLAFMFTLTFYGFSQNEQERSNIQTYTPSKLLSKGQWDIKFFNSVYTQTERTDAGTKSVTIPRETFFTNTTEIYTGISAKARVNIGLVFQIRSNTFNGAGALDVFKFKNDLVNSRSGLTTLAPSIRVQPFVSLPTFSVTSSVYFPVFKDEAFPGENNDPVYLDKRSVFWETKFFYDNTFGADKWQIFTEIDLGFNFGEKSTDADFNTANISERYANNSLFMPISAFLSYFPTSKSTIFINGQQAFLIDLGNNFSQNYTQLGFGGKYQITKILNIEASFGKFIRGYSFQGLGQTFSLGLRALF
ncbi:hypothetical protein KFZ70_07415 [Tamlana fucoidanivorans]|uniref:Uncharacterized protein n=1 Tax=Allotamlana fucoidanivorans TaxID=2583814 RepID=A0A5C4SJX0_9FLAO|nr:hypothetical protein [Tamlana fucoidanivorans]TNJ43841.1 hypothetical protein FGF67_10780 [Tamlana fucoidanivorans]